MTYHLFGAVLTAEGIASNNRGENEGNVSTLQKIVRRGRIHSTVSAEAIRYAMREYWASNDYAVNRAIDGDGSAWQDPKFKKWQQFVDDDLFGFMLPKSETVKRRGVFEITRALSTRPWTGDVVFGVASPGSHPGDNKNPIPYVSEVHSTRYQFLFALTPEKLAEKKRVRAALEAVENLNRVAGNHSRYLYEFAPEAIILRWTQDPVPRMSYCYEESEHGDINADKLLDGLRSGDIASDEIVAGGRALGAIAERLREDHKVSVHMGVKAAFQEIRERVARSLEIS